MKGEIYAGMPGRANIADFGTAKCVQAGLQRCHGGFFNFMAV
jgi:hypothetical protein